MKDFIIAVDLGQAMDYSAAVVLHRQWWRKGQRALPESAKLWHEMPVIVRWELGTPYPRIVEEIAELHSQIESDHAQLGVRLIVDAEGPGRPVIDMLKAKRLFPVGVVITGGEEVHQKDDGILSVPKKDICSALIVAYQSGDIKLNPKLEHAKEFESEVKAFGYVVKPKSRTIGYESLEKGVHDDIVVAAALGLWYSMTILPAVFFEKKQLEPEIADMDYNPLA